MICLTTENGAGASNTIYLEPEVFHALIEWSLLPREIESPDTIP
jgi:hypothetical protein